jgi:hypothetical protein
MWQPTTVVVGLLCVGVPGEQRDENLGVGVATESQSVVEPPDGRPVELALVVPRRMPHAPQRGCRTWHPARRA